MTEQEIVNILKENKTKGIAYLFLPEDVWNWLNDNYNNPKLLYLAPNGKWESFFETDFDDCDNVVFALPDMYELPVAKVKGEWVEFDIDENGCYRILDTDMRFHWSEWNKPLWIYEKDENRRWYLTTFGGWQYEASKPPAWFLAPQIENDNGFCDAHFADDGECKPAIPIKIRFWRENKCVNS